jgi:o-succinylbenzoate---CoA ligase
MAPTYIIDWTSSEGEVLFNPRMPLQDKEKLLRAIKSSEAIRSHIALATSGTSGQLKWVLLSRKAILASAAAVNRHLRAAATDRWLNPLPLFHMGGLGIHARGFLCGASVVDASSTPWNPHNFVALLTREKISLTALVPAQVFDLVMQRCRAPERLRAVIVGGGALAEKLYHGAVALGWRLLPSYGLTESSSQVATASLNSWENGEFPSLQILDHMQVDLDEEGCLKLKSPALLAAYLLIMNGEYCFHDPKKDGWFTTEDRPVLDNGRIQSITRGELFIKIGGESVDWQRLERILEEEKLAAAFPYDAVLIAMDDARLGKCVHLATTAPFWFPVKDLMDRFHGRVFPFERIREVHHIDEIPRSSLKKVLRNELKHKLESNH